MVVKKKKKRLRSEMFQGSGSFPRIPSRVGFEAGGAEAFMERMESHAVKGAWSMILFYYFRFIITFFLLFWGLFFLFFLDQYDFAIQVIHTVLDLFTFRGKTATTVDVRVRSLWMENLCRLISLILLIKTIYKANGVGGCFCISP